MNLSDKTDDGEQRNAGVTAFVSYARSDMDVALRVVRALEARGVGCTIDTRDLPYGERWQAELEDFIRGADAIVFLVSPRSVDSRWCKRELAQVGRGAKPLVPAVVIPTPSGDLPAEIAEIHLVDLSNAQTFDVQVAKLAQALTLAAAPDVTLRTVVGLIDTLKPLLRAGELDLMVGTESPLDPGFTSQRLAEDHIVVAASVNHPIFAGPVSLRDLTRHRWVLQPPGAPTRDWLDHTFDRKRLPRPKVQVESTMLLMLPALIAETGLLSFISRHHLDDPEGHSPLKEVAIKETTMHRRLVVTYRESSYLTPAARMLITLLQDAALDGGRDAKNLSAD